MCRRRSARAASAGSWVTTTTVRPLSAISRRMPNTCSVEVVSSAPVGSSATMISGRFDSARAIATRCRWPPDSWFGRLLACSFSPSEASSSSARVAHLGFRHFPRGAHRQHHIVKRGELRQQEVKLEHEAASRQAHVGALGLRQLRGWLAADDDVAFGRRIEQAEQIKQRGFAGARRPGDGEELPLFDGKVDAVDQRVRHRAVETSHQTDRLQRDLAHEAPLMISTGCTRVALRAGKNAAPVQHSSEMPPTMM